MNESPDDQITDAELADDTAHDTVADTAHDTVPDAAAVALPQPSTSSIPSIGPDAPITDYTDDGTPTFDYVRDRIEGRFATSLGAAELAGDTAPAASLEEQFTAREQAGRDRLEEIRRAMRKE
ncbi:MAG TPA: hypothetical protein VHF06_19165 [Pseudonocardiaceae bacterium]|jgi:hypothetical protein|nr:hypothetical protein [Pseudonocardiaceae bacterium]